MSGNLQEGDGNDVRSLKNNENIKIGAFCLI